mgnify:CR=1 FL=1
MSRVTLALAAAAGLSAIAPAAAADMYGAPPAAPAYGYASPAPANNWNGVYAGVQAGHAWGTSTLDGTQLGLYGGLNTNVGQNVIAGVEADLNISGQTASRVVGGNLYRYSSDWNATIRPRIGIGFDRVMPYATAGLAFSDDTLKALGSSSSNVKIGYAAGAGVEGQVTDRISVKGEYVHLGFGRSDHTLPGGLTARSSVNSNVLRAGAAYRF